ncbi:MAG: TrkA family potassium uptake protein [Epulopiscium sp.]|nr:TrkA family potassium uptake protein [Candidatus Epulonipiscium sp.]
MSISEVYKSFVVFGLGRFGLSVAYTLSEKGYDVLVVDQNEEIIQEISDYVTHAVQADATDLDTLKTLGIGNFDVAVVAIGSNMQSSIMTALLVKELGVKYVLAKAQNNIHKRVLEKIGVDRVVFPERDMGIRVANKLVSKNIVDFIELSSEYSLVETGTLPEWIGKSLKELNIRAKYGINVMAIRHGSEINISPNADVILHKDDILVVIGSNEDLSKLALI